MADRHICRGKRVDTLEWIEGYYMWNDCYCFPMILVKVERDIDSVIVTRHEVIPETVGQYTGLTDKNGKRIFEGDIVSRVEVIFREEEFRVITYVGWQDETCSFVLNPTQELDCSKPLYKSLMATYKHEVIGNIHDDPELLEEQNNERT